MRRLLPSLLTVLCLVFSIGLTTQSFAQVEPAATQQIVAPDYEAWERTATRAEEVLDAARASNESLEELRSQLVDWRDKFSEAEATNAERIRTLRSQLEALGAEPEGDATEPDEIATRRSALFEQLNTALAPVRRAEEAYSRADGLIGQLDRLIRDRQTNQILRLDPTPLNPVLWPAAIGAVGKVSFAVRNEISNNYASDVRQKSLRDGLPLTLLFVVVGLLLVFRAGAWVERGLMAMRARQKDSRARFRVAAFVASIFGVILPVLGIIALLEAVNRTELTGFTGDQLLGVLAATVTSIAAARWLSLQIFPKAYPPRPVLPLAPLNLREGRFYAMVLAALLSLRLLIVTLTENDFLRNVMNIDVQSVLHFPIIIVAGLMLFRLGQLMLSAARNPVFSEDHPPSQKVMDEAASGPNLVQLALSRTAMLIGVGGPILAAIGYISAGGYLVFASVLTLALLALIAVLQRFVRDFYAMVTRDESKATALIPILMGFALVLMALPVLALIWGARLADLSETWTYIGNGFQIGESRISPTDFLTFAIIFVIGYILTRFLQGTLKTQVLPKTRLDVGGKNAIVSGVGYVGIFLAALIAITSAGIDLSSLAIVAGALSIGVGFGLQTIVSNFVSGIILLIERPISEGDWIEVGGTMGVVRDISVRATRIETFDRRDVIVPNADLISTSVTNWTKGNLSGRIIVPVGVAYGSDTKQVEGILQEIAEAHPVVIVNPPPSVLFRGFGADSMDFEIRAILRDVNYSLSAVSDINHEIAKRFAEEGVEIPFAQRDVWLRNPETLPGAKKPSAPRATPKPKKES